MKTALYTIFAALVLLAATSNTTHAAALSGDKNYTVLTDVSAINKIEVRGNVELYVSDAPSDQVKVYSQYYSESALVQNKNGVLRIASYKPEKLVVWVSAADLRSVSAYDNSEVKSFGNLSKFDFDVDLHDNASAKLNLDAFTANVTVTDNAKADLTGTATSLNLTRDIDSNVKTCSFAAIHINERNRPSLNDAELARL